MNGALLALFLAWPARADGPPKVVVVPGGCPDLCCSYGEWRAKRKTRLYAAADSSRVVGLVSEGDVVTAGDSALYVRPRKVKITMETLYGDAALPKGSVVYLIRQLVDGTWRVWYKGAFVDGMREMWEPAESAKVGGVWWVQVQTSDGKEGWTRETASFDGSRLTSCQGGISP